MLFKFREFFLLLAFVLVEDLITIEAGRGRRLVVALKALALSLPMVQGRKPISWRQAQGSPRCWRMESNPAGDWFYWLNQLVGFPHHHPSGLLPACLDAGFRPVLAPHVLTFVSIRSLNFDVSAEGGGISIPGVCHDSWASLLFPCPRTNPRPRAKSLCDIEDDLVLRHVCSQTSHK